MKTPGGRMLKEWKEKVKEAKKQLYARSGMRPIGKAMCP